MVEYRAQFLKKLEVPDFYLVKFRNDKFMEKKAYPSDNTVNDLNERQVIFIIHDESIFLINNSQHQAGLRKNNIFLRPKKRKKSIMV